MLLENTFDFLILCLLKIPKGRCVTGRSERSDERGHVSSHKILPHIARRNKARAPCATVSQPQHISERGQRHGVGLCAWWWLFFVCRSTKWRWNSWCSSTPTSPSAPSCRTARGPWREPIRWAGPPTCLPPPPNAPAPPRPLASFSRAEENCTFGGWSLGRVLTVACLYVFKYVYLCLVCILHTKSAVVICSQVSWLFFLEIKDYESHKLFSF